MYILTHPLLRFSVRFLRGGGIAGGNVSLECDTPAKMAAESLCTKDKNLVSSNSFVTHATFFTHVTFVTLVTHVTFVTFDSFNPFISCDSCSRIDRSLSKNSCFIFSFHSPCTIFASRRYAAARQKPSSKLGFLHSPCTIFALRR